MSPLKMLSTARALGQPLIRLPPTNYDTEDIVEAAQCLD